MSTTSDVLAAPRHQASADREYSVPDGLADYQVLSLAGRGAFGSVWVARDRTGVLHALKVVDLARLPGHDPGEREEQALALVRQRVPRHPHLVEVSHVSRVDGRLVYAMELADAAPGSPPAGQEGYRADTLAQRVLAAGRLPVPEAVRITLDLLSALEALHAARLVHRDVKPHNVVFVGGVPKLADVGLAAVVQTALSVAGTPRLPASRWEYRPGRRPVRLGQALIPGADRAGARRLPVLPG